MRRRVGAWRSLDRAAGGLASPRVDLDARRERHGPSLAGHLSPVSWRPPDAALFDREILDQIREVGGEDLLLELFGIFVEHSEGRLAGLREARAAGDREAAARVAHSIRSSASSVGALRLAERAGELESLARSQDAPPLEVAHESLARSFAAVLDELRRRLAATGGAG